MENRIVFSAHLTNYAEDGHPTDQHAAYYAARAAGGAGLIITSKTALGQQGTKPSQLRCGIIGFGEEGEARDLLFQPGDLGLLIHPDIRDCARG